MTAVGNNNIIIVVQQPVQRPSSESSDSEDDFCTGCQNVNHKQQSPGCSFSFKVFPI